MASPLQAVEDELGVQDPVGFWDPLGFSSDGNAQRFRRRRQADLKHGGISMLATMGYIASGSRASSWATFHVQGD